MVTTARDYTYLHSIYYEGPRAADTQAAEEYTHTVGPVRLLGYLERTESPTLSKTSLLR